MKLPPSTALLVIDVQEGFNDPRWGERNNPHAEENITRLLAAWRAQNMPVMHAQHDSPGADGAFRPGTPGNRPKPGFMPLVGESVHRKTVNSMFIGTGLEEELRSRGVQTVVIVGLTTNHCVSTTARMAGNLGFKTHVVSDACAAFARPTLDGLMRSADEVHAAALSDLQDEFATVLDTAAALAALPARATA
ncbi:cysteine hydrolase [Luteibacter jiangsuensis]|uniref:Cysteine hydrolase n=1 Tax=Luteibacter jiangsuensis TaxID=637577 RepID=A0ABX0Q1Z8_9GAMM|nr:cysteine hydrolase family protein [Luteibacter jiangsuensis]NID04508.1 cysteine hydrolase [Luteibacter jiangsuensis]